MGIAGLHAGAVLAGTEHHVVLAGIDVRALGEEPLGQLAFVVAQGIVVQGDAGIARVVDLDPVAQLPVLVPQAAAGGRHDLVDAQGVALDGVLAQVGHVAVLGVGLAGAVHAGDLKGAVLHADVGFVGVQGGDLDAVDHVARRVEQEHRVPGAGQLEFGVEGQIRLVLVGIVAEHQHGFPGVQRHIRENEFGLVAAVGQGHVQQGQGFVRCVHQLHPVAEGAVIVRQGGAVGRHDLADHQPLVCPRALAAGVERLLNGLPGADRHHEKYERQKQHQHQGTVIVPSGGAAGRGPAGTDELGHETLL